MIGRHRRLGKSVDNSWNDDRGLVAGDQRTDEKPLRFHGHVVLHIQVVWNNELTRGTRIDGEIYNRLSIYKKSSKGYVAEQYRFNDRVIVLSPELVRLAAANQGVPFISLAEEFLTLEEAIDWIRQGDIYQDDQVPQIFDKEVERHAAGLNPKRWPAGVDDAYSGDHERRFW